MTVLGRSERYALTIVTTCFSAQFLPTRKLTVVCTHCQRRSGLKFVTGVLKLKDIKMSHFNPLYYHDFNE